MERQEGETAPAGARSGHLVAAKAPDREPERLRRACAGYLGRSADVRPTLGRLYSPPTLDSYCAPYRPIANGSGSCQTDAEKEQEEPCDDSKAYDCRSHISPRYPTRSRS